jgi:hypothetical protein
MVLWQILGRKSEDVKRGLENVPLEELCDVHSSSSIITVIKSMKIARLREECRQGFDGKKRDYFVGVCVNARTILIWILENCDGRIWVGCFWLNLVTRGVLFCTG